MSKFMKAKGLIYTVLMDSHMSVMKKYGIEFIPTSYFINQDGNIVSEKVGPMSATGMDNFLKKLD